MYPNYMLLIDIVLYYVSLNDIFKVNQEIIYLLFHTCIYLTMYAKEVTISFVNLIAVAFIAWVNKQEACDVLLINAINKITPIINDIL